MLIRPSSLRGVVLSHSPSPLRLHHSYALPLVVIIDPRTLGDLGVSAGDVGAGVIHPLPSHSPRVPVPRM